MRKEKCPNESNEPTRTNCDHCNLYLWHDADKVSALPDLFLQKTHAENGSISGQGAAVRGFRTIGRILPEARLRFLRLSRNSGVHRNRSHRRIALMEKANAALHCRRHGRLHAVTSTCILAEAANFPPVTDITFCSSFKIYRHSPPRFDLCVAIGAHVRREPASLRTVDLQVLF